MIKILDDDDFGFTAVDEREIDVVSTSSEQLALQQSRIDKLKIMMNKLVDKLMENPDKDYIYWPNRFERLEGFKDTFQRVADGEQD